MLITLIIIKIVAWIKGVPATTLSKQVFEGLQSKFAAVFYSAATPTI